MKYSESDVTIYNSDDALNFIREHPERFLPFGCKRCSSLIGLAVNQILSITEANTTAFKIDNWWGVSCEVDWITLQNKQTINQFFKTVTPCPQSAINSICIEVVLYVFANDVISISKDEIVSIKGKTPTEYVIVNSKKTVSKWKRILMIRCDNI
ncbi:MAG: hypothetical protein RLN82_07200 [Pseudomonadales bacterium]